MNYKTAIDLRPNPLLLNPFFEGYKLSLESVPLYRKALVSGVYVTHPGEDQYSFFHVKLFSLHNHLHVNQHRPESAYCISNDFKVLKISFIHSSNQILIDEVFKTPCCTVEGKKIKYNVSAAFASPDIVLLYDGTSAINIAKIYQKEGKEVWEILHSNISDESGLLCDARIVTVNNIKVLNLLLLTIGEKPEAEKGNKNEGSFQTIINWKAFIQNREIFCEEKYCKKLGVDGFVDYIALEPNCKCIYLVSDKFPHWIYDSVKPTEGVLHVQEPSKLIEEELFSWSQTDDTVTVQVPLPEDVNKIDISITISDSEMIITIKKKKLINGIFFQRVDKDQSYWIFEKNCLKIELTKQVSQIIWKSLLVEGGNNKELLDTELQETFHKSMEPLCEDGEKNILSYNSQQQLEECDNIVCDTASFLRLNSEDHQITHYASLSSNQWLFKVNYELDQPPAICCRHDIDACVWQFKESNLNEQSCFFEHVGTFSAFGYVQASKIQKKFIASPPNLSYVVICEASHRIYIYRQPCLLNTELKNRHTGKKVNTICKQQLVNLETNEQILGVHATNNILYVLLEKSVCVLAINL